MAVKKGGDNPREMEGFREVCQSSWLAEGGLVDHSDPWRWWTPVRHLATNWMEASLPQKT